MSVILLCVVAVSCDGSNSDTAPRSAAPEQAQKPLSPDAQTSDEHASARATFRAVCARCHGADGQGGAVDLGEGATLKVPSLNSGQALADSDAEYARQIAQGGKGMPAFGKRLSPEQIGGLVRFIRSEVQGRPTGQ